MKRHSSAWIVILGSALLMPILCAAGEAPNVDWGIQFGSTGYDFPREVAVDANGNVYVVGETNGNVGG
ncbi:MAG TPA: SBBP repeat-containing protein, partial [bacterium]